MSYIHAECWTVNRKERFVVQSLCMPTMVRIFDYYFFFSLLYFQTGKWLNFHFLFIQVPVLIIWASEPKKRREYLIGLMNGHEWINGRIVDTWPANEEFINICPKMLSLYSCFWNANPPNIPLIWRCAFVFLIHRAAVIWIFSLSFFSSASISMNSQKGFCFRFWLINTFRNWNEIVHISIRLWWMLALSNTKPVFGLQHDSLDLWRKRFILNFSFLINCSLFQFLRMKF